MELVKASRRRRSHNQRFHNINEGDAQLSPPVCNQGVNAQGWSFATLPFTVYIQHRGGSGLFQKAILTIGYPQKPLHMQPNTNLPCTQ